VCCTCNCYDSTGRARAMPDNSRGSIMNRASLLGPVFVLGSVAAAQNIYCQSGNCLVSFPGYNPGLHLVLCETYRESVYVSPISAQVHLSDPEVIWTGGHNNCSNSPVSKEWTYSYMLGESIEHTSSGTLTAEVSFKVGQKDVGDVGMSGASVKSGGWKWATTWSQQFQDKTTTTIAACTGKELKIFGRRKIGDHFGSGRIDWFCDIQPVFFGIPTGDRFTASGSCGTTISDADGEKWWVNTTSVMTDVPPACAFGTVCNCPTEAP